LKCSSTGLKKTKKEKKEKKRRKKEKRKRVMYCKVIVSSRCIVRATDKAIVLFSQATQWKENGSNSKAFERKYSTQ